MRSLEEFYCTENEIQGNGSEKFTMGICKIKSEWIRPEIFLLLNGDKINFEANFRALH